MKKIPFTRKAAPALAAVSFLSYFFWLSGGGLGTKFSHDDLMNIYRGWLDPLPQILKENLLFVFYPTAYRPFGNLFYHVFFSTFGFNPIPYRVFLLAFLLANVFLVYAVMRRLSGSREIGAVAAVLHGYRVGFVPLYRNTGTCFDIFCFFFYFCALLYYIRIRQRGRLLRAMEHFWFLVLFACALNAKEIAVTLPVMVALYELLYHPPRALRPRAIFSWISREGMVACWAALVNVVYLAIKIYGPHGVTSVGGYKTTIRISTYLASLRHDLDEVFVTWGTNFLREPKLIILILLLILIAWRLKRPHFRFALLFWLTGVLPVAFIPARSIYAVYIPLAGFDACMATIIVEGREFLRRLANRKPMPAEPGIPTLRQAATFGLLLLLLGWFYIHRGAHYFSWLDRQNDQIAAVIQQLRTEVPRPKTGARFLFLKDPFEGSPGVDWATVFITRLLYRDNSIQADRLWLMQPPPDSGRIQQYDYVFTTDDGGLVPVKR